jgi:DNA-binding transcriptional LysR family regulator
MMPGATAETFTLPRGCKAMLAVMSMMCPVFRGIRVVGHVSANNLETVNELALRGHGVALLPGPYLLAGALGHLERVLPAWTSAPIPVHAVYLNRKFVPAKVQGFIAELANWKNSTWRSDRPG